MTVTRTVGKNGETVEAARWAPGKPYYRDGVAGKRAQVDRIRSERPIIQNNEVVGFINPAIE